MKNGIKENVKLPNNKFIVNGLINVSTMKTKHLNAFFDFEIGLSVLVSTTISFKII